MGELLDATGALPIGRAMGLGRGIFLAGKTANTANVLVYLSFNTKKLIQYVGITNNFAARAAAHFD